MKITLTLPQPKDAKLWLKVRKQKSTQENNPIGVLSEEKLSAQLSESNFDFSAKKSAHRYFIEADNNFAGVIAIRDIKWDSGVAEIGYLISEEFQGQGVATKAVELILEKAFAAGLQKVKATTSVVNTGSYKVLLKNKFVLEGYLKNEFLVKDKLHDVYLWAAHRNSFENINDRPPSRIRPARVTDAEDIHRLCAQLEYSPSFDDVVNQLPRLLIHPDYEVLVIQHETQVVGWMTLLKRFRIEDTAFLQVAAVVTEERFRGQGFGKELMEYSKTRAKELSLPFVGLYSSKRRTATHDFYEKIGFKKSKESFFFTKDLD